LASAVDVKILALFIGPASVYSTGPYINGSLILQTDHNCGPCSEDDICPGSGCRQTITPDMVLNVSKLILENCKDDVILPEKVKLFRSEMDHWGVSYRCLNNLSLDIKNLMKICYREMGKKIISQNYDAINEFYLLKGDQQNFLIDPQFVNGIINSGKVILNKAYTDTKWIAEDSLLPENHFWSPWIDTYLENYKYRSRNTHVYINALETGLKFISKFECHTKVSFDHVVST